MIKKILASLILATFISFLVTFVISGFLAKREIALQRAQNEAGNITFGEILVPVGFPFPYTCAGLCKADTNIKNLLKDTAVFYIPSYILVYFLLEVIIRMRIRLTSK